MRKLAAAVCCVAIFAILLVYQFHDNQNFIYTVVEYPKMNKSANGTKIILTWTDFFGKSDWLPRNLSKFDCAVSDCIVTSDKRFLKNSSAVIFHWRGVNIHDVPENVQDQVWILYNMESPMHTPRNILKRLSERLNWTVTYRHDSDFTSTYGRIVPGKENGTVYNKTSLVAWLVSNCNTASKREDYVHELSRYVQVDVYGKCGKKFCPHISASECYQKLSKRYRFYLSFENSICKDYVTEKLFYAIKYGMVPVVLGGADYKSILPPRSYIDTSDFASPKVLADYLRKLSEDENQYASYFKWRDNFKVDITPYRWLCDVCQRLHENYESKTPVNYEDWWYGRANCRTWKDGKLYQL